MICTNCKYYNICGDDTREKACDGFEANKYPEYIMRTLRKARGLEADDISEDSDINTYTPNEAFEQMLHWEGIIGYAEIIKEWIASIYGIDLDNVESATETEEHKD